MESDKTLVRRLLKLRKLDREIKALQNQKEQLLNEYEEPTQHESTFRILSGAPANKTASQGAQSFRLAQTGPASILLILIALSTLAYLSLPLLRRLKYMQTKKAALKAL